MEGAALLEVVWHAADHPLDDFIARLPAVAIGERPRDRRHVGRVRDDAVEPAVFQRLIKIAAHDLDIGASVDPRIEAREVCRSLGHVGGHHRSGRGSDGDRRRPCPRAHVEEAAGRRVWEQFQELAGQRVVRGEDDVREGGERRGVRMIGPVARQQQT
jgi:hypothetical protein